MSSRHTLTRKLVTPLALALALSAVVATHAAPQNGPFGEAVAIKYPLGETVVVRLQPLKSLPRAAGKATVKRLAHRYTSVVVEVEGLPRATDFDKAFTTYVLWAVTPEGSADNLAELKRDALGGAKAEVTTTLETFALVVTAEPHFMMRSPSSMLVMENQRPSGANTTPARYLVKNADYFRAYLQFNFSKVDPNGGALLLRDISPQELPSVPASLLGANQAVSLARLAGAERDAPEEFRRAESAYKEALNVWRSLRPEAEVEAQARAAVILGVKAEEAAELNGARRRRSEENDDSDRLLKIRERLRRERLVNGSAAFDRALDIPERAGRESVSNEKEAREKEARAARLEEKAGRESKPIEKEAREETTLSDRGLGVAKLDTSDPGARTSAKETAGMNNVAKAAERQNLRYEQENVHKENPETKEWLEYESHRFWGEPSLLSGRQKVGGVASDLARFGRLRPTPRGIALVLPDNSWAGARAAELSPLADVRLELLGALLAANPAVRIAVEVGADGVTAYETQKLARERIKAVADRLFAAGVSGVHADAGEGGVVVKRYPNVECQEVVVEEQEFTVQVSLTEGRVTPQVEVVRGADPYEGERLLLTLPVNRDDPASDSWQINAVILAPNFVLLDKSDIAAIKLPRTGDSQVVAFRLKPRSGAAAVPSQILVSFWHDGEFLARVARTVTVVKTTSEAKTKEVTRSEVYPTAGERARARSDKADEPAPEREERESKPHVKQADGATGGGGTPVAELLSHNAEPTKGITQRGVSSFTNDDTVGTFVRKAGEILVGLGSKNSQGGRWQKGQQQQTAIEMTDGLKPDLTLHVITRLGSGDQAFITVDSRYLQLSNTTFRLPKGADPWLAAQLRSIPALRPRDPTAEGEPRVPRELARERLRGFGIELYKKYAPPAFKEAFWQLLKGHPKEFKTIQIYTDNPNIPWELMKPVSPDGVERDFLGLEFSIGRWHVNEVTASAQRPPNELKLNELVAVSPEYTGARALPALRQELKSLTSIPNFRVRRTRGRLGELKELFAKMPDAIIHFAGHGSAGPPGEDVPYFTIELEDGQLDPVSWRGMVGEQSGAHPLFFFNACEVGRAERSANFVNGWAPVVLESGASGYIGALWPLGDKGAAEFARIFYGALGRAKPRAGVAVSDILRLTRREYLKNGDPTFLAYVYYGDPNLRLVLR